MLLATTRLSLNIPNAKNCFINTSFTGFEAFINWKQSANLALIIDEKVRTVLLQ